MRSPWTPRRKIALASIACAEVAGVVVLVETTLTDLGGPRWPVVWWIAYGLFLITLFVVYGYLPRPRRLRVDPLLVLLILLATVLVVLFAEQGWIALLYVVTAVTTAFHWRTRTVVLVIIGQTAAVGLVVALGGWPVVDVIMGVVAYLNFQAFGALVVMAARGEATARRELAVAHAELRTASSLLEVTSRDAERLQISRDLHDIAGHKLTALALELEVASHLIEPGEGRVHVDRARMIGKDLLAEVRAAVGQLRSGGFDLEPALRSLTRDVPGLRIDLRVTGAELIRPDQAQAVLRFAQESITNSLRHAEAGRLDLQVEVAGDEIRLSAADDGRGAAAIVPGHGLTGMRERLEALGGRLDLRSVAGAGFVVTGSLPIGRASGWTG